MKLKGISKVIMLGALMTPLAAEANSRLSASNDQKLQLRLFSSLKEVSDLPLYQVGPEPIPSAKLNPYLADIMAMSHHVFVRRTSTSLIMGARVKW